MKFILLIAAVFSVEAHSTEHHVMPDFVPHPLKKHGMENQLIEQGVDLHLNLEENNQVVAEVMDSEAVKMLMDRASVLVGQESEEDGGWFSWLTNIPPWFQNLVRVTMRNRITLVCWLGGFY